MKVLLRLVDIDGRQTHDISDSPMVPDEDDLLTFEVRPTEWLTRRVTVRRGIRFEDEQVIIELELGALEDDEEA